jgi:hypothetical protein
MLLFYDLFGARGGDSAKLSNVGGQPKGVNLSRLLDGALQMITIALAVTIKQLPRMETPCSGLTSRLVQLRTSFRLVHGL